MKQPKKTVGPRIQAETIEFYKTIFPNVNAGAEYAVEMFRALYRKTLTDLKGYFTTDELNLIIEVHNSVLLLPAMSGQHLPADVADGIALDGLDEKWKIDGKELNDKISKLHIFQIACLEIWANGFWYASTDGKLDIEKHVQQLS